MLIWAVFIVIQEVEKKHGLNIDPLKILIPFILGEAGQPPFVAIEVILVYLLASLVELLADALLVSRDAVNGFVGFDLFEEVDPGVEKFL